MTQTMKSAAQTAESGPADASAVPAKPQTDAAPTEIPDSASPVETQESATAAIDEKPQAASSSPSGPSGRLRDISFDDLKFDINKGDPFERSLLTDKVEALDGKHVCLRGFILPSFQQTGLTQFVLVRDNLSCCFGPGAAIYDCVIVEMKPGRSTDYSLYPVAVDGTFTIREMLDPEGKAVAIYHLDGEQVR